MKSLSTYEVVADSISAKVKISEDSDNNRYYELEIPKISKPTGAYLESIKDELIKNLTIVPEELIGQSSFSKVKKRFLDQAKQIIKKHIGKISDKSCNFLATRLVQSMMGFGDISFMLADVNLEEVCINSPKEPIWVYHKKFGWLKSNISVTSNEEISNYASMIGRRIGKSINILNPMLDAYLPGGERLNATIYPISISGNTLTIRKFLERPWTITDYLQQGVLSYELAALLWMAMQYEMNLLVTGGTATGKTSMVNVLAPFLPKNQRIISIEEVREIKLPSLYQWVPLVVRSKNIEGAGNITMFDLLVNSLRMRPDRILVGEVRRKDEVDMLFEAMHTGHSIISTIHAETSDQLERKLTTTPFLVSPVLLESMHLILTMYRDRRTGLRRVFELNETIPILEGKSSMFNTIYKWVPAKDTFMKVSKSFRIMNMLKLYTRMSDSQITKDLKNREKILKWVVKQNIIDQEKLATIFNKYNLDPENTMKKFSKNPKVLLK